MSSKLDLPVSACGCQNARADVAAARATPVGDGGTNAREAPRISLAPGLSLSRAVVVDRERSIDVIGDDARVYATPMLVRDVEVACREALLPHLAAGQDSVGTRIELDHLAATPIGMAVTLDARVTQVDGRQVSFAFEGRDEFDVICRGSHVRVVVDVAKAAARLAAKAARSTAGT